MAESQSKGFGRTVLETAIGIGVWELLLRPLFSGRMERNTDEYDEDDFLDEDDD